MYISTTFGTLTGSQAIIPVGTKAFTINVVSGSAYANETLLNAPSVWTMGLGDSKLLLETPIALGTTGVGSRVTYMYLK